jgi:tetratricopeptide (TPR) repeat protein
MGRRFSPTWYCVGLLMAVAYGAVPTIAAGDQQMQTAPVVPAAVAPAPAPLLSLTDSTAPDLEHQGDLLRAQKRYLDAIDYYSAAIAKEASAIRYNKLGMALLFLQRNKEAEKAFNSALRMDSNCAEALNNRGFVEQLKKNYSKAGRYYEKALVVRPGAPTFHYNLASVYFARHKYDQAAQEYRTAYQLDPDIFNRVSRMGVVAQTSSPEDRAAFAFMVAKMYAQAGDFDRCLQYLRKAMEEGYKGIDKIYTDSEFATLRTDKRFSELMVQKPQALP